jgi:hypothetical protein
MVTGYRQALALGAQVVVKMDVIESPKWAILPLLDSLPRRSSGPPQGRGITRSEQEGGFRSPGPAPARR